MRDPKQITVPGGYISVSISEQTIGGIPLPMSLFTAMLVLGGSVVYTTDAAPSASKAVAAVATWLHGLTASVSEIAAKMRLR